jgi:hypothetical protein
MFFDRSYFAATCHPWMSGLYIVAMLLCYEIGVWYCQQGGRSRLAGWNRCGLALSHSTNALVTGSNGHQRDVSLLAWASGRCGGGRINRASRWLPSPEWCWKVFVLALPLLALARAVALWGNTTVPGTTLTSQRGASILASLGAGVYEEIVISADPDSGSACNWPDYLTSVGYGGFFWQ